MSKYGAFLVLAGFVLSLMNFPLQLYSQEDPKSKKQIDDQYETFKKRISSDLEIQELFNQEDSASNIPRAFIKTELPNWLSKLKDSGRALIYTIGISDPGMNQDSAYQLAVLRARVILSLMTNAKISGLTDYYVSSKDLKTGEVISSVYKEIKKISGSMNLNKSDFVIEKVCFTNNGEAIVLAAFNMKNEISEDTSTIICEAEFADFYTKKNNRYSLTSRMEVLGSEDNKLQNTDRDFSFMAITKNDQLRIASYFGGSSIKSYDNLILYKATTNDETVNDDNMASCTLQHGLWYAFSTLLLQNIILNFQDSSVEQSNLSDNYMNVNENFTRILNEKEASFKISEFEVRNNKLYLELQNLTE